MKYLNKSTLNHLLILLALITVLLFFRARFILKRLPRDIPIDLSVIYFFILLFICLLYVYTIRKLIKPSPNTEILKLIVPIATKIITPFILLNEYFLNTFIGRKIILGLLSLRVRVLNTFKNSDTGSDIYIYLFCLPKFFLAIMLLIDCFYNKQLYLFYSAIVVISIPLFTKYILFSGERLIEQDIKTLDKYFIVEITSEDVVRGPEQYDQEGYLKEAFWGTPDYFISPSKLPYDDEIDLLEYLNIANNPHPYKYLAIKDFLKYQAIELEMDKILYKYNVLSHKERDDSVMLKNNYDEKTTIISRKQCEYLLELYPKIMALKAHINVVKEHFYHSIEFPLIKNTELFINCLLLFCWSYILFKSIHTLQDNPFMFLTYILNHEENPFI